MILDKLKEENFGYKDELFNIPALFFADDGLLLAHSLDEARRYIKTLVDTAKACGLDINMQKSNILIFNKKEHPESIEDIGVTTEIRYLGVTITNKRNCFNKHKEESLMKAKKFANLMYSTIAPAYNRVLIGKTFWKSYAMPSFMFASEIIEYTKAELEVYQKIDNQVYRAILEVPAYTANAALRGEVGASCSRMRDMKNKILYVKHILQDGNELLRSIFLDQFYDRETKLIKLIKVYMKNLNINLQYIENTNIKEIKNMINEKDTEDWRKEVAKKKTLEIYNLYKINILEIKWFDNSYSSNIMVKARTDTLNLNWRMRHSGRDEACICGSADSESMEHFILECIIYNEIRRKYTFIQRPYVQDTKRLIADILLFLNPSEDQIKERKSFMLEIWNERQKKIKELENSEET